jgi:hypothetical protein
MFQKYKVTDTKEVAQLIENLKQKIQAKAQRIRVGFVVDKVVLGQVFLRVLLFSPVNT